MHTYMYIKIQITFITSCVLISKRSHLHQVVTCDYSVMLAINKYVHAVVNLGTSSFFLGLRILEIN